MPRCFEPFFVPLGSNGSRQIGHGNFSEVELARPSPELAAQGNAPEFVAVKMCRKDNEERLRILRREAEVYQGINEAVGIAYPPGAPCSLAALAASPTGIIGFYGYFENEGEAALVLEHGGGGDLMAFLAARRAANSAITENELRWIMRGVLTALVTCHETGYAHRDVKPHNVLVMSEAPLRAKLADFGLAKKVGASNLWARQNSAGDYDIMPPQVKEMTHEGSPLRRRDYFRSDAYAAGVTMFYLVDGNLPTEMDVQQLAYVEQHASRWPQVSGACLEVMHGLLTHDEEARLDPVLALSHDWFNAPASPTSSVGMGSQEPSFPRQHSTATEAMFTAAIEAGSGGADGDSADAGSPVGDADDAVDSDDAA